MTFKVVVFSDENVVAIVPSSWLDGNSCCLWPPYTSSIKSRKAVQKQEEVQENWKSFPIRVLGQIGPYITIYISVYIFSADIFLKKIFHLIKLLFICDHL